MLEEVWYWIKVAGALWALLAVLRWLRGKREKGEPQGRLDRLERLLARDLDGDGDVGRNLQARPRPPAGQDY